MPVTFEFDPLTWVPVVAHVVLAPAAAAHALLRKRDSRSAFGWISVCLLFPLIGPFLYYLFGINRVSTRARALGRDTHAGGRQWLQVTGGGATRAQVPEDYRLIARISDSVSRMPLLTGNAVKPLHNGEQAYPAMRDAIAAAKRYVYLSTYIFESNTAGRRFVEALVSAARRGVDVRVLIDGMGEMYSWPRVRRILRRAGVNTQSFLPVRVLPPSLRVNLRNHRKILVCDGRLGFAGGINIGDRHLANDPTVRNPSTDLHFRFAGPVVAELEQIFVETWNFATGDDLALLEPPADTAAGNALCRAISDGPSEDLNRLATIITAAISAARSRVAIMTPYFLPPREMVSALQSAALRGVETEVILPAKNNLPFLHWATRKMLWELLMRGVRIYYQPPPFCHSKLFVVDSHYALVGSANLDPRSLRLNFELGVEVHDPVLAVKMLAHFDMVRDQSQEVTLEEVDARSLPVRLRDAVFWLFSPYL